MSKIHTRFQTKMAQKRYCLGEAHLYSLYKGASREVALLNHCDSNHEDDKVYLVFYLY